jgi:guanylate kinase
MYYLIVGATCAGKDKIAGYIADEVEDFKIIRSTTSRPIRPGEKNGVEYYFVSDEGFRKIMDEDGFIEYRVYHTVVNDIKDTWYYGLEKKNVADTHTDYIVVMDYKGAEEFMEYFGRETWVLIYVKS